MARILRFLTHPQVTIDPASRIEDWALSAIGVARIERMLDNGLLAGTAHLYSSAERKALDGAHKIAERLGLAVEVRAELGENDRSATGYLPRPEFEAMADRFFAEPETSVRGWETAVAAQSRIVGAFDRIVAETEGPVAIMAHGAVGALLLCRLKGIAITRAADQSDGGGCHFAVSLPERRLLHEWRPIEEP